MAEGGGYIDLSSDGVPYRGWDNTRQKIPTYSNNNVFLGVPNVTQNTLPFIEPFIGGYGRVFCLMAPAFFRAELRGLLMRVIERFCKGLSGISNYELNTAEMTYGNNAETYTVPVGIKKGNTQFNLRFQEMQGGLFRKLFKYWTTGIADLGSGYGTYHGGTWDDKLRFSPINHTAVILYALTDNSGGAYGLDSIEFACMWYGAFPTMVPNSHFEFTQGEHNTQEIDMSFNGIFHENNTINSFAAEMLAKSNFYKDNYADFDIGPIVTKTAEKRFAAEDDNDPVVPGFEPVQKDAIQYTEAIPNYGLDGMGVPIHETTT
jgi:hypothetical protein